jgi:tetratricopeptide (TPR) repeat protein
VAFDEAVALAERGQYKEACAKFEESDRLDHAVNTLYNLADCYEKLGRITSAWEAYSKVANEARQAGKDSLKKDAQDRADALKPRISKLTIEVPPAVAGLSGVVVTRNGAEVDADLWNQSIPVDAGDHSIVVSAPTKSPWRTSISINEAQAERVSVPDLEAASMPGQRIGALAAGGVGAAGLILGGLFGGLTFSKWGEAKDACAGAGDRPAACPSQAQADSAQAIGSEARSLAMVSNIGFVVGGVGLVAAGVLWFTAPSADSASAKAPVRIGVTAAGPGSIGGAIRGAF